MTEKRKRWAAFAAGLILAASIAFPAGRATAAECLDVVEVVIPDCPEGEMLYVASEDPLELACKPIPPCQCNPPRLKRVKPGAKESAQGPLHPPDFIVASDFKEVAIAGMAWNRWSPRTRPFVGIAWTDPPAIEQTVDLYDVQLVSIDPPAGWSALLGVAWRSRP